MSLTEAGSLTGMNVVSGDAYIVGDIMDMRYDPVSWTLEGLKVRCTKGASNVIGAGTASSKKQAEQNAAREALRLMGYDL